MSIQPSAKATIPQVKADTDESFPRNFLIPEASTSLRYNKNQMLSSLPLPLAAFVAGLISFLSPCVLPLVPGYVSMISGAGVDELQEPDAKLRRTVLLNSIMFILGFSIVFIMLGAAASGVGRIPGHNRPLQPPDAA